MSRPFQKCRVYDLMEYKYRRLVKDMPKHEALKIALINSFQLQMNLDGKEIAGLSPSMVIFDETSEGEK